MTRGKLADAGPPVQQDRRLLGAAAIGVLYGLLRAGLYSATPRLPWEGRDTLMDFPRALCLFLTWLASRSLWRELGGSWARPRLAAGIGSLTLGFGLSNVLLQDGAYVTPVRLFLLLVFNTVWVALFEEALFRGLLLHSLRVRMGDRAAVVLSTLGFVVFHVQAQPLKVWPGIGAYGLLWASSRCAGVGLAWLVVIHFAVDVMLLARAQHPRPGWFGAAEAAELLIALSVAWLLSTRKSAVQT